MKYLVISWISCQLLATAVHAESFVVDVRTLHTLDPGAAPLADARIVVVDGLITCLGQQAAGPTACSVPAGARHFDFARSGVLTPGYIESLGRLGQVEVDAEDGSHDGVASKESNLAQVRAIDGVAMGSRALTAARLGGVTTVLARPLGGALIAGQSVAFRTSGLTVDAALVRAPVAVHVNLGEEARQDMPLVGARSGQIAVLRTLLQEAKRLAAAESKKPKDPVERESLQRLADDPALAVLATLVWKGRLPLVVHAHRSDEIAAALRLRAELGFRLAIAGGAEAWLLAAELAAAHVPVILGPIRVAPFGWNTRQARPDSAAILHRAGVQLVLAMAETHNARNLRFEAGFAVANGLPPAAALAAITRVPAEVFGLPLTGANAVGVLRQGQLADFAVTDGDPLGYDGRMLFVAAAGQAIEAPRQR